MVDARVLWMLLMGEGNGFGMGQRCLGTAAGCTRRLMSGREEQRARQEMPGKSSRVGAPAPHKVAVRWLIAISHGTPPSLLRCGRTAKKADSLRLFLIGAGRQVRSQAVGDRFHEIGMGVIPAGVLRLNQ